MTSLLKEQLTGYELGCEGGCELMEIICPNGLKGGVRPGLGDGVIRLGLKPQRGRDTIGPYKYIYRPVCTIPVRVLVPKR